MEPDVIGTAVWLAEIINSAVASDNDLSDFVIGLGDGKLGLISPEAPAVYLITVEAARFEVVDSSTGSKP